MPSLVQAIQELYDKPFEVLAACILVAVFYYVASISLFSQFAAPIANAVVTGLVDDAKDAIAPILLTLAILWVAESKYKHPE